MYNRRIFSKKPSIFSVVCVFSLPPDGGGGEEAVADTAVEAFALEAVGVAELDEGLGIECAAGSESVSGEEVGDGVAFRGQGVKKVYGAVGEGEVVVGGAECPL